MTHLGLLAGFTGHAVGRVVQLLRDNAQKLCLVFIPVVVGGPDADQLQGKRGSGQYLNPSSSGHPHPTCNRTERTSEEQSRREGLNALPLLPCVFRRLHYENKLKNAVVSPPQTWKPGQPISLQCQEET